MNEPSCERTRQFKRGIRKEVQNAPGRLMGGGETVVADSDSAHRQLPFTPKATA